MNKGLLYAMLIKLSRPTGIFNLVSLLIIAPFWIATTCVKPQITELWETLLMTGPAVPAIFSYFLVRDQIGNNKSLSDGEYLSLLFTRPLTRANYVMSKWIASSVLVSILVILQQVIFHFALLANGHASNFSLDIWTLIDCILNSSGVVAVIVLVNSLPPKVGVITFVTLLYISMFASLFAQLPTVTSHAAAWIPIVSDCLNFLKSIANPSIQLNELVHSTRFTLLPILTYCSNVSIYLTLAVFILGKREFYYASN